MRLELTGVPQDHRECVADWIMSRVTTLMDRAAYDRDVGDEYHALTQEAAASEIHAIALQLRNPVPGRLPAATEQQQPRGRTIELDAQGDYIGKLKERMTREGITQSELATEMKLDPSQVSRWFNRKGMQPRLGSMKDIDRAMDALKRKKSAGRSTGVTSRR